jgi:hypothetical protein
MPETATLEAETTVASARADFERLIRIDAELDAAEENVDQLKAERLAVEALCLEHLTAMGTTKTACQGKTIAIRTDIYSKHLISAQDTIAALKRDPKLLPMVQESVNTQTLSALVREWLKSAAPGHEAEAIPVALRAVLGYSKKTSVRVTAR